MCENMFITLSTDKEGKKTLDVPKCMPIDTNQHTPTKIIDGCHEIIKILADKKTAVAQHAAMQYG